MYHNLGDSLTDNMQTIRGTQRNSCFESTPHSSLFSCLDVGCLKGRGNFLYSQTQSTLVCFHDADQTILWQPQKRQKPALEAGTYFTQNKIPFTTARICNFYKIQRAFCSKASQFKSWNNVMSTETKLQAG